VYHYFIVDTHVDTTAMPVFVDRPNVRVAAHRTLSQPDLCLDFEWCYCEQLDETIRGDEFEVCELPYGGLITNTRLAGNCVRTHSRYVTCNTESLQDAEHQWRGHEQRCCEDLRQMFGFIVRCVAENLLLTVESVGLGMAKPPMAQFVSGCVTLYGDGPFCGNKYAAHSFANEGTKQAI